MYTFYTKKLQTAIPFLFPPYKKLEMHFSKCNLWCNEPSLKNQTNTRLPVNVLRDGIPRILEITFLGRDIRSSSPPPPPIEEGGLGRPDWSGEGVNDKGVLWLIGDCTRGIKGKCISSRCTWGDGKSRLVKRVGNPPARLHAGRHTVHISSPLRFELYAHLPTNHLSRWVPVPLKNLFFHSNRPSSRQYSTFFTEKYAIAKFCVQLPVPSFFFVTSVRQKTAEDTVCILVTKCRWRKSYWRFRSFRSFCDKDGCVGLFGTQIWNLPEVISSLEPSLDKRGGESSFWFRDICRIYVSCVMVFEDDNF